jgi:hypothetical protein
MNTREVTQITSEDFGTTFKLEDTATEAYATIYMDGQVADVMKLFGMQFVITGIVSSDDERVVFKVKDRDGTDAEVTIPNGTVLEQAD